MKKIVIEGCGGCPKRIDYPDRYPPKNAFCSKILDDLDITWSVNPAYFHPDCPLEDEDD
jgi:hypothetical protein